MFIDVGAIVKINPDIFGANPKEHQLYGDLGYLGVFRHLKFQIVKMDNDPAKGKVAFCTATNVGDLVGIDGTQEAIWEGECTILVKDMVSANEKITLDYTINATAIDNRVVLKELMDQRSKTKKTGKGAAHPELRENWKKIQEVRTQIEKGVLTYYPAEVEIILTRTLDKFKVASKMLPDNTEEGIKKFKMHLANLLRMKRKQRKILKYETKVLFFEPLTKLGGVYIEGGQPMKAYEKSLLAYLREDKVPKNKKKNYLGIEIEFVHIADIALLEKLFIKEKLHKNVQITEDHSVKPCHNNKGYMGSEIRILTTVDDAPDVLTKVCKVLGNPKIDGYVNRSCGLHVHLDVRNRDANIVYRNFVKIMNLLVGSQPVGRTNSHFCVPNKYADMHKKQDGLMKPKYILVNPNPFLDGRGTIEVRVHEGSVDADQIINWAMFLNTIADHPKELPDKTFKRAKDLNKVIELPDPCIGYVDSRIEKFSHGA